MSLEKVSPELAKAQFDSLMRHCGLRTPGSARIDPADGQWRHSNPSKETLT